jgi:hypothetical protein
MRWVAPTEKDEANHQLEKRPWAPADQFHVNSGLKACQYFTLAPIVLLIVDNLEPFRGCILDPACATGARSSTSRASSLST